MTAHLQRLTRLPAGAGSVVVAAVLLAGCASPPARFYTLDADAAGAPHEMRGAASFLIQVPAVEVPDQMGRNQFVIQKDTTQVAILEQERWASPPADEIRRALSSDLTHRLDTIDVIGSVSPSGVPVYRVSVNVRRFESWPGARAVLDAVWSVRAVGGQAVMTCGTQVAIPVTPGYDALVAGHRQAIDWLAGQVAEATRLMDAAQRDAKRAGPASSPLRCPVGMRTSASQRTRASGAS